MIVENGKFQICRVGKRAGDRGKNDVAVQVQRQSRGRIPFALGTSVFFLLSPSTDWMRPTYIRKGNLLYSKNTPLNVNRT